MVSVFIPCIPKHARNLYAIVGAYMLGTVKPREIIIGLSRCKDVPEEVIRDLSIRGVRFEVFEEALEAGPCRQLAKDLCVGDVVAYQDADDLPMPNRIEAIGYFFDKKDIMVLNHEYYFSNTKTRMREVDYRDARFIGPEELYREYGGSAGKVHAYGEGYGTIHAGVPCVRRCVLDEVAWKCKADLPAWAPEPRSKSEDYVFCFEALLKYRKSAMVLCPLYIYTVA